MLSFSPSPSCLAPTPCAQPCFRRLQNPPASLFSSSLSSAHTPLLAGLHPFSISLCAHPATAPATTALPSYLPASGPLVRAADSVGTEVVAVVGGTGFVGQALVSRLLADGSQVRVLTRSAGTARRVFGDRAGAALSVYEPQEWSEAVQGSTAVVNLAGTPISTRWTPAVKANIVSSRVESTAKVADAILSAPKGLRPSVFLTSSAVGFYGVSESATFDESSPAGSDFLAKVCVEWEAAAQKVEGSGTRLVIIRNGIVLDRDGGALAKMLPIFQLYAGGPLGSGTQWMSWIHRSDLVSLFIAAIRDPAYQGVVNGTAPNPVRVAELCEQLGRVLGRPSWLPVPEFAVKALLGEGASVVLDGQKVLPKRAEALGFKFEYRYVSDALGAILGRRSS